MPQLQLLDIASNGLTSFTVNAFPMLQDLNLSGNNIEDEKDIQACENIHYLKRLCVWGNPFADAYHPALPTQEILPSRPDITILPVDPISYRPQNFRAAPGPYTMQPTAVKAQAIREEAPYDAAFRLQSLLD